MDKYLRKAFEGCPNLWTEFMSYPPIVSLAIKAIELAIEEERERCARISESHGETIGERCWNHENTVNGTSTCWKEIAKEIRNDKT